jgi:hypothetical protein
MKVDSNKKRGVLIKAMEKRTNRAQATDNVDVMDGIKIPHFAIVLNSADF